MNTLILVFGIARLSYMLTSEDCPWRLCDRFRQWIERYTLVFDCPYCLSLWLSVAILLAFTYNETITVMVLAPFALSAASLVVVRYFDGG